MIGVDVYDKFGFMVASHEFNFMEQAIRWAEQYPEPKYEVNYVRIKMNN
jgi:hypothetical protein